MDVFMEHTWPGNVRELQHAVEAAVQMSQGPLIGVEHLPPHIVHRSEQAGSIQATPGVGGTAPSSIGLVPALEQMEANMLRFALDSCEGNVSAAARRLGIPRQTLQHKLRRHNITPSAI